MISLYFLVNFFDLLIFLLLWRVAVKNDLFKFNQVGCLEIVVNFWVFVAIYYKLFKKEISEAWQIFAKFLGYV